MAWVWDLSAVARDEVFHAGGGAWSVSVSSELGARTRAVTVETHWPLRRR